MIELRNITKKFGDLTAVDNISFNGRGGTVIGFLGPNGAGKSTTMRMITGYMPPTAGEIYIDGVNVNTDPMGCKSRIGYLPEDNPLYGNMNSLEYLEFCGRVRNMEREQLKKRIKEVVDICAIKTVAVKPINMLSKGFRQRVGLAQAILHAPPILILDEPTSGLDPNQIQEIRNLISKLKEKKLIILSTHIMQEAQANCRRVIIINKGCIVADGGQQELTAVSENKIYDFQFDGPPADIIKKLQEVEGVAGADRDGDLIRVESLPEIDPRKEIFNMAAEKNWPIMMLNKHSRNLEEVFRSLTKEE